MTKLGNLWLCRGNREV